MQTSNPQRPIAITCGDPAGIGPDIILQAYNDPENSELLKSCLIIGNKTLLAQRAKELDIQVNIGDETEPQQPNQLRIRHLALNQPVIAGKLNPANSEYVLNCINEAAKGCLKKDFHAMVTAPVHKGIINDAGYSFSGHTEWIADKTGTEKSVMMLADDSLRVCLATTHIPLRQVADAITESRLTQILNIVHRELQEKFSIESPCIGVCGLNPHAGEGGHLGNEEITTITPTLDKLRKQGMNLVGPLPADTIFIDANRQHFDAIVAMYHDQGLPVIKQHGFGEVVNITLGLPIIRTSVDHGTALDLAGTGKASESSLIAAIKQAIQLTHPDQQKS